MYTIMDFSRLAGKSVDDFIPEELFFIYFYAIDDAVRG